MFAVEPVWIDANSVGFGFVVGLLMLSAWATGVWAGWMMRKEHEPKK